jgi:hypothetical protein
VVVEKVLKFDETNGVLLGTIDVVKLSPRVYKRESPSARAVFCSLMMIFDSKVAVYGKLM